VRASEVRLFFTAQDMVESRVLSGWEMGNQSNRMKTMDRELVKVWTLGGVGFWSLNWSVIEIILKCLLTLTILGYTLRKWYLNEKRVKRGKPFETDTDFNEKYGD
jgi:hypothetical protein